MSKPSSVDTPIQIDKSKTGLVIIDLQNGIVSLPTAPHDSKTVVSNASKVANAFRENKMPVFLVHVAHSDSERLKPLADEPMPVHSPQPKDWAEFLPEIGPKEGDIIITKKQWGAFYGTELELQLRRRKIDTIVLCGISTNIGVESTARFAYEYGYQQIFVEDATSARSAELHDVTMNNIFKRIGRIRTTEQVLQALNSS